MLLFFAALIIVAVYISQKTKPTDDYLIVQGRFIKIIKADSNFSKLYLKLKNDSIVVFKTVMQGNDPGIELFKKGGFDIAVTYKEYTDPVTNTTDKIVQSILPVYDLKR